MKRRRQSKARPIDEDQQDLDLDVPLVKRRKNGPRRKIVSDVQPSFPDKQPFSTSNNPDTRNGEAHLASEDQTHFNISVSRPGSPLSPFSELEEVEDSTESKPDQHVAPPDVPVEIETQNNDVLSDDCPTKHDNLVSDQLRETIVSWSGQVYANKRSAKSQFNTELKTAECQWIAEYKDRQILNKYSAEDDITDTHLVPEPEVSQMNESTLEPLNATGENESEPPTKKADDVRSKSCDVVGPVAPYASKNSPSISEDTKVLTNEPISCDELAKTADGPRANSDDTTRSKDNVNEVQSQASCENIVEPKPEANHELETQRDSDDSGPVEAAPSAVESLEEDKDSDTVTVGSNIDVEMAKESEEPIEQVTSLENATDGTTCPGTESEETELISEIVQDESDQDPKMAIDKEENGQAQMDESASPAPVITSRCAETMSTTDNGDTSLEEEKVEDASRHQSQRSKTIDDVTHDHDPECQTEQEGSCSNNTADTGTTDGMTPSNMTVVDHTGQSPMSTAEELHQIHEEQGTTRKPTISVAVDQGNAPQDKSEINDGDIDDAAADLIREQPTSPHSRSHNESYLSGSLFSAPSSPIRRRRSSHARSGKTAGQPARADNADEARPPREITLAPLNSTVLHPTEVASTPGRSLGDILDGMFGNLLELEVSVVNQDTQRAQEHLDEVHTQFNVVRDRVAQLSRLMTGT
ncbi:hypothetical protein VNI00_006261 [Paramarasmius palmivorus]|uniref:Uncharacterized protein n=1 Tax=Paramarasmius palmivorus TaxID=297713 RepID=A0AAW0D5P7_9AGAR